MHAGRGTRSRILVAAALALAATVLPVWAGEADVEGGGGMSMPTPQPLWAVLWDTPEPDIMQPSRMHKLRIYWPLYLPQLVAIALSLGAYVAWALRAGRHRPQMADS